MVDRGKPAVALDNVPLVTVPDIASGAQCIRLDSHQHLPPDFTGACLLFTTDAYHSEGVRLGQRLSGILA